MAKFGIKVDEDAEPEAIAQAINEAKGIPEITAELQTGFDNQLQAVRAENDSAVTAMKETYETQLNEYKGQVSKVTEETKEAETNTAKALTEVKAEMEKMRTEFGKELNSLKANKETAVNTLPIDEKETKGKKVVKTEWSIDNAINNMPLTTN